MLNLFVMPNQFFSTDASPLKSKKRNSLLLLHHKEAKVA
jgi:hypothetical protein